MTRLIPDSRIVTAESLDRARCALIDNHSLTVIDDDFKSASLPRQVRTRDLVQRPGGTWLAHVIQSFVLYDTLVVDSALFEKETAVSRAYDMFPDAVAPVFIKPVRRNGVGKRVEAGTNLPGTNGRPTGISDETWTRWEWLDSSEKPAMDRIDCSPPRLIPPEYVSDREVTSYLDRGKPVWPGYSLQCLNSGMNVARAHFYLELSRELEIPLNIDPIRTNYLGNLLERLTDLPAVSGRVVSQFAQALGEIDERILEFGLNIPPVAEYVLRSAQDWGVSLYEATIEIRNSSHAQLFRKWCADLFRLWESGGLRDRREYSAFVSDFEAACETWAKDIGEGVDHRLRRLKLGGFPIVGKVLTALGADEISVKDPMIVPGKKHRHLFFLNDLLRDPRKRSKL